MNKLKHFLFLLCAALAVLPLCVITFILGGIDALAGTDFHESFYEFVERTEKKFNQ
ncbi:MAG: hypothetical protein LBD44_02875 [Spirochaetaceae bacterium]|jgi:hypothetical protein|nr:hypothetical protein [Spirochaetaceae bacterium]